MRRYLLLLIALLSLTRRPAPGTNRIRCSGRSTAPSRNGVSVRPARRSCSASLKQRRDAQESLRDRYRINDEIIDNYTSFVCDSATSYIHDNLRIAETLGDERLRTSRLRLAFVYSPLGAVRAGFRPAPRHRLQGRPRRSSPTAGPASATTKNLTRYTGDRRSARITPPRSRRCATRSACPKTPKCISRRKPSSCGPTETEEAEGILTEIYRGQTPDTHSYAMAAMSLAKLYREAGDRERENRFLEAGGPDRHAAGGQGERGAAHAGHEPLRTGRHRTVVQLHLLGAQRRQPSTTRASGIRSSPACSPIIESNYLDRIETQRGGTCAARPFC